MGLALHCHGELKLKNGRNGRERNTKRKMEPFPQALAHLQALQNVFFVPPYCQRWFPLEIPEEIGLILPHQHKHRSTFKKCEPISAQRPKLRKEWSLALNSGAELWKMRNEWGSTLNSDAQPCTTMFISSILAFFFFLLWLITSLAWDKSLLSLNWSQKWGLVV